MTKTAKRLKLKYRTDPAYRLRKLASNKRRRLERAADPVTAKIDELHKKIYDKRKQLDRSILRVELFERQLLRMVKEREALKAKLAQSARRTHLTEAA